MKRIIILLMLAMSIKAPLFAQETTTRPRSGAEKTFGLAPERIRQRFWIDLGKGNRLRLELEADDDIGLFSNTDSLLLVFLNDMKAFKDSLSDPLATCRVDYVIDTQDRKKIRIQKVKPQASSFVLDQGEPSALKLDQDTVNIIIVSRPTPHSYPRWDKRLHYSRLTLYLNQYQDIVNYITGGLNAKISWLQTNQNIHWVRAGKNRYRAKEDLTITGALPNGAVNTISGPDMLSSTILLNTGNYKNYFVPSFSLGFTAYLNRPSANYAIGMLWEPDFLFGRDAKGVLQTYRNDFLSLSYAQAGNRLKLVQAMFNLDPSMSLSWLIHREGDYFDKNTFRLTFGGMSFLKGDIKLEPGMYFNNFFRGVTPSVRAVIKL